MFRIVLLQPADVPIGPNQPVGEIINKAVDQFERGQTATALIMVLVTILLLVLGFTLKVVYDNLKDLKLQIQQLSLEIKENAQEAIDSRERSALSLLSYAEKSIIAIARQDAGVHAMERTIGDLIREVRDSRYKTINSIGQKIENMDSVKNADQEKADELG